MSHGLFYRSPCYVFGPGNIAVALLSTDGLRFHQKYLNLCFEDERRSYRFGTTWGRVINDRIKMFGWTNALKRPGSGFVFFNLYKHHHHSERGTNAAGLSHASGLLYICYSSYTHSSRGALNCPNMCSTESHPHQRCQTTDRRSIACASSSETAICAPPQPPAAIRRRHIGARQAHIMIMNMPPCLPRKHELWSYFCITAGKAAAIMLFARF